MILGELKDWLSIIGSIIAFIGVPILIYKTFSDPDKKADKDLSEMKVTCDLKHSRIDEIFKEIKESILGINGTFRLFKQNEFKHIEDEMRRMSDTQTEIVTILKEREKK